MCRLRFDRFEMDTGHEGQSYLSTPAGVTLARGVTTEGSTSSTRNVSANCVGSGRSDSAAVRSVLSRRRRASDASVWSSVKWVESCARESKAKGHALHLTDRSVTASFIGCDGCNGCEGGGGGGGGGNCGRAKSTLGERCVLLVCRVRLVRLVKRLPHSSHRNGWVARCWWEGEGGEEDDDIVSPAMLW